MLSVKAVILNGPTHQVRPCGLMDKAPDFGSGDCRFESCHGRINKFSSVIRSKYLAPDEVDARGASSIYKDSFLEQCSVSCELQLLIQYPQINHEFDRENNFYDQEYSSHSAAFVPNNIVCVHNRNFIYSRHTCDSSMVVASCTNIELCIK